VSSVTAQLRSAIERRASPNVAGRRFSVVLLFFVLILVGIFSALQAVRRPFWYDEICTVTISRLPNMPAIWDALDNGADGNPPPYYAVARLARRLTTDDHLGYRLPSIVGAWAVILCTYLILCRRLDRLSALTGAVFVLATPMAAYATEARPYALMVGCAAGAILAWQRIADRRMYSIVLALMLAAALCLHYYAILIWPAFILGEAAVLIAARRFRPYVWAALLVGATPLVVFAPMLFRLRQYYGAHIWARASIRQLVSSFDLLLGIGAHSGLVFAVASSGALMYWIYSKTGAVSRSDENGATTSSTLVGEFTIALGFLWLPVVATAAGMISRGGMTTRYMLPAVLGGSLVVGYLTSHAVARVKVLLLLVFLANYALSSGGSVRRAVFGSLLDERAGAAREVAAILDRSRELRLPAVVSSGMDYLPMVYYKPPDASGQLYVLSDAQAALKFANSDSLELGLLVLSRYSKLQVENYRNFASKHREFLLFSRGRGGHDWWPERLAQDGDSVILLEGSTADIKLYKVVVNSDFEQAQPAVVLRKATPAGGKHFDNGIDRP